MAAVNYERKIDCQWEGTVKFITPITDGTSINAIKYNVTIVSLNNNSLGKCKSQSDGEYVQ